MKKNYLAVFFIPIFILAIFYFVPHNNKLRSNFNRKLISNKKVLAIDTIHLNAGEIVDGMVINKNNLWLNERYFFAYFDGDYKKNVIETEASSERSPIVNFYVENNHIYYLLANARMINVIAMKDTIRSRFDFSFPATYFIELNENSFLFQEATIGTATDRLHFKDFKHNHEFINDSLFSKETGSGIRYSGSWFASSEKTNFFFVPQYEEQILCFDSAGNLKYKFKPIDFQNQKLEVIKEGDRFYLSPQASVLRLGACASKNNLFVSSYVIAENQVKEDFNNYLTIDVYQIDNGKYKFSFYVPS